MINTQDQYSIALWGPTASGKTWLIRSFAKKLDMDYTDDPNFSYEIIDAQTGIAVSATPPSDIQGTKELEDSVWIFRRVPKAKLKNESQIISSYEHRINIRDDMGSRLFNIDNTDNEMTLRNVVRSDYLLIMLDPLSLDRDKKSVVDAGASQVIAHSENNDAPNDDAVDPDDAPVNNNTTNFTERKTFTTALFTPLEYIKKLELLFQALVQEKGRQYYIAICITKIDRLKIRQRDPWEIIELYFGREMYGLLRKYASMPQIKLETFSTSAFGYVGSKSEANYDEGHLKNDLSWRPYNVEAPLFWLFDKVEKERLQSSASGTLANILFSGERQAKYIPYSIKRK